jgi:hypothetical protein
MQVTELRKMFLKCVGLLVERYERNIEKAKEKGLMGYGVVVIVGLVGGLGYMLSKGMYGGSEYVVYDKAIDVLREDAQIKKEFGEELMFGGEGGGRQTMILHNKKFSSPQTGEKHVQIKFHMWDMMHQHYGDVFCEMRKKSGLFWDEWVFNEISVYKKSKGRGRSRKLKIIEREPTVGQRKK